MSTPASPPPAMGGQGLLEVPAGAIYYEVTGRGEPVVFLHGGFGDRRMWDYQVDDFAKQFVVIRLDLRGFGRSPESTAPYSAVADVIAVLDRLNIERVDLVGNSMGGGVAIDLALQHPKRVRKLVLVCSAPNGAEVPAADRERVTAVFRLAQDEGADQAVKRWLADPMVAVANGPGFAGEKLRMMVTENRTVFRIAHWPMPATPAAAGRLAEILAPTLVISGSADTPANRALARLTAHDIAGAEYHEIQGTDHLPQLEEPTVFNRLVLGFLRRR